MNNAACGDPSGNHDIANASIAAVLEPGTLALAVIGGFGPREPAEMAGLV